MGDFEPLFVALIGGAILVTFFIMALWIKRIMDAVEGLVELEFRKPENQQLTICENCQKEFTISIAKKDRTVSCPHCNTITRIV